MLSCYNMNKLLKVGVLMGGPSSEHDISLMTGQNIIENLDKSKYEPVAIKISKEGQWFLNNRLSSDVKALQGCDLVFNALHGVFGEDGTIQAIMDYRGVKYTGSGVCASALGMDKLRSREIFKLSGLNVPKTLKIRRGEYHQALLNLFVGKVTNFPVVVKPCSGGSSVGVKIVKERVMLDKALKDVFKTDRKALIEEFIEGREFTCGVLENVNGQSIKALPVTEIIPKKGHVFFDYSAKYKTGHSDEVTPASIDDDTTKAIQDIAIKTHQVLGCGGYSRTDVILKNNGDIVVLEINTLPGLTMASLLPKAAIASGLTFTELLDTIISSSLV